MRARRAGKIIAVSAAGSFITLPSINPAIAHTSDCAVSLEADAAVGENPFAITARVSCVVEPDVIPSAPEPAATFVWEG
ncbi:MAG: hypothetical protein Q8P61_00520 [Candidatus Nanopelagicales bacterium]|nr:hypothetical protein [Candidatus Nanopelagicales bacterium]